MKHVVTDQLLWLIDQAQQQLESGAIQSAKHSLASVRYYVETTTRSEYEQVIKNLWDYFEDGGTTYTKVLEQANSSQNEITRMSNNLLRRRDNNDPDDIAGTDECTEFFFMVNTLMWVLKPLAKDAERSYDEHIKAYEDKMKKESEGGVYEGK